MPAKIGGRVTAPAASAPDFLGEAGRRFWRFTGSPAWQFSVDLYPVLAAASLPWSTSAVLVFMSIWFIALIPTIDILYARWIEAGRSLRHTTAFANRLLDLYGEAIFTHAVTEILQRGLHDPGALAQLCEQQRRARARPVPIEIAVPSHVPDRDVIPHNLEDYDDPPQR